MSNYCAVKKGGILFFMHARFSYAVKIVLSVAIVFVLSGLFMRYVTFGDRPELDRKELSSELADIKSLVNQTITAMGQFPDLLMKSTQTPAPTATTDVDIPPTANIPVAVPAIQVAEQKIAAPVTASRPATIRQVLGTSSGRLAD